MLKNQIGAARRQQPGDSSSRHIRPSQFSAGKQLAFTMTCSLFFHARRIALAAFLILPFFSHAADNSIVIGQAIDLSGPNGSSGRDYVAGIKTYFDSLNSAGGINGKQIQYIVHDDQGQPETAAKAIAELIGKNQADYLFGGIGDDVTKAVMEVPAFKRSNQILFAPLSGSEQLDRSRVVYWRPSYTREIDYLFAHFTKLGAATIGIAYQESASSQETYRNLINRIAQNRLKLGGTIQINGNTAPPSKEIARFAAARPHFVIVIADTIGTGLFLKAFRKLDSQTFVAGTSLINLSTLQELAGPEAIEWTVFSQVVPNPASGASMLQLEHLKMMRKFRDEAVSSLTLEGFAAAKTLVKAIQQSKKGGKAALQDMMAEKAGMDLGGLSIVFSSTSNHLSSHLDIALLNKTGLKF